MRSGIILCVALLSAPFLRSMDDHIPTDKLHAFINSQEPSTSSAGRLLHDAVVRGQDVMQLVLRSPNIDLEVPNQWGDTVLLWSVRHAHQEILALLLDRGANADAVNMMTGNNALHLIAATHGNIPIAATWALRVSDQTLQHLINEKDLQGYTPLHLALLYEHGDMVVWLLDHGANPYLVDVAHNTALHIAVATRKISFVRTLLDRLTKKISWPMLNKVFPDNGGSMIIWPTQALNTGNIWGNTPLHIAAGQLNEDIYSLLLDYRAHPYLVNNAGQTPSAIKLQGVVLHISLAPNAEDDKQQCNESTFDSGAH